MPMDSPGAPVDGLTGRPPPRRGTRLDHRLRHARKTPKTTLAKTIKTAHSAGRSKCRFRRFPLAPLRRSSPAPLRRSLTQLAAICRGQCDALTFSEDCFGALRGHPFVEGAARHVLVLLDVLHQFSRCFDNAGQRTPEGQRLYQDHFTGGKAWFSDSSDAEKEDFKSDLTFKHPTAQGETLFCTWHGKVKTPQIRIHFSWPVRANEPLYVVYVGPKITKR